MLNLRFDNTFVRELPGDPQPGNRRRQVHGALFSRVEPTPVAAPRLVAHSPEVAALLDIPEDTVRSRRFAEVFGGNALVEGMQPYAANYGGHQFGNWAGQLGDGRAISLGETINSRGERWELQLKGAGATPYARSADGRAVLRSSIREFLCSEAMFHLGVPTTRALSLVATGELVERDMFYDGRPRMEPGAVVCRVAPSFIRFGNFELPASRGDHGLLDRLIDFTIRRDFPELDSRRGLPSSAIAGGGNDRLRGVDGTVRAEWFAQVCERTAVMVAHWMRVGFVHGVMNTDNMSILGLTIDYGPYGWIDNFDLDWTPNTTDAGSRRYRFGYQPQVAHWNLGRLASAIAPSFGSLEPLHAGMARFEKAFIEADGRNMAAKLGLAALGPGDEALVEALHALLAAAQMDMTIFFRALARLDLANPATTPFGEAFYDEAKRRELEPALMSWLRRYAERARCGGLAPERRVQAMNAANPKYVLRNYLAQQAIDRAAEGDPEGIHELLDVMRRPYDEQPGREAFAARRPEWARDRAGCSMLSCSS